MRAKPRKRRHQPRTRYTVWDELLASPTVPMPEARRRHQLTRMLGGLDEIATGSQPTADAWRVLSDAVNLLETLVEHGPWLDCAGDVIELHDSTGLLPTAVAALAEAGERMLRGKPLRLDGPGMYAVREVLCEYTALLETLPERTVIKCHRETERRLAKILARIAALESGVRVMAV